MHGYNGKVVFISCNLPYNAARFAACDAILITYSNKGMKELPDTRTGETLEYGPNIPAAVYLSFTQDDSPDGKLPVNIPTLDKEYGFTDHIMFQRGFGLSYRYLRIPTRRSARTIARRCS